MCWSSNGFEFHDLDKLVYNIWEKDQMRFEPFVYHWHHCLVQTSVIHISKIHGYGLLDSFGFISFEGCEFHLSK